MCEQDNPEEVRVSVARDGYPALVFVEFEPRGEWRATVLTHRSGGALDHLDARARGVLRAYAVDLLARLAQENTRAGVTVKIPGMPADIPD